LKTNDIQATNDEHASPHQSHLTVSTGTRRRTVKINYKQVLWSHFRKRIFIRLRDGRKTGENTIRL